MPERRTENRKTSFSTVEISFEFHSKQKKIVATMEDISERSMGFRTRTAFPIGLEVEIKTGQRQMTAKVRRCVRMGYEYLVGVRFSGADGD